MECSHTIEDIGYEFQGGKLRHIKTGEPFKFDVYDDHSRNQERYEALGETITPLIYEMLVEECNLTTFPVPFDPSASEPTTKIFCSENFLEADKLMILIHGSGAVRAGQWSRRLIINDSLDSGTQIPFIKRAMKDGFSVVVLNTNDNLTVKGGQIVGIRGSESAKKHGLYVWEKFIRPSSAKKIAIVAHSYGGVVTTFLFEAFREEFCERVFAVALTDSVHFNCSNIDPLMKMGRNWVTSHLPLDTPVHRNFDDIPCVSAGCLEHELTSWSSFESVFKFIEERLTPEKSEIEKNNATDGKIQNE